MSKLWRDTYDSWKARNPEDEILGTGPYLEADLESDWEAEYAQWVDEQRARQPEDWLEIEP